ncbi:MAG: LLM class flavin-dependent oxidoreductase [Rhodothermales bacterium]|nr:LLM class flavin-dependent oxidoreductase [Rhodothermales bacterium]
MELGIYSFAESAVDPSTGRQTNPEQRLSNLLEEIELADRVGLDVFGIGEHHRPDYAVSSPATVLAAAAVRTKSIRLTSSVTVLSSEDPVRVFQQYSTIDLLSRGRAEIMAGRGSFIESYPLFGFDLQDYDSLFSEKLDLLLRLRQEERITWSGKHRPSLEDQAVFPRPKQDPLPVWIAVGGTPQSVVRAGTLGLPLALAIIGGQPARFAPLVKLYRQSAERAGHDPAKLEISINSHGFIADESSAAAELAFPPYVETMGRIGRERGWPPPTREHFETERSATGAMLVGDPQEVIDKILYEHELFGNTRFLIQFTLGPMPHNKVMRCIELFGSKVAPAVRKALA